jgi:hypothetical protein
MFNTQKPEENYDYLDTLELSILYVSSRMFDLQFSLEHLSSKLSCTDFKIKKTCQRLNEVFGYIDIVKTEHTVFLSLTERGIAMNDFAIKVSKKQLMIATKQNKEMSPNQPKRIL